MRERLVASAGYLQRRGTPRTLDELPGHDLLAWASPDGDDPTLWPGRRGRRARVAPFLVSTDIHLLRLCAAEGTGIAFPPDAGFPEPAGIRDSLVPVLPDEVGRERSIRVVVPAVLSEIPRIRAVLAEIRSVLRPPR